VNHARDRRTSHVGRLTVAQPVDACLTPSLLHALASVHEPERWLSPLARRPGAPQRLGQVEGAAALYRRSLPMPNFRIRRGRRIT
jgi:hypothetical protein